MNINVLGSGYMGKQICSLFVVLGHDVKIWQNSSENLDDFIQKEIIKLEKYFNLKADGKYTITKNLEDLDESLTIESIKEDIFIKKDLISKLKFQKNIFSNTSSLLLSEIGNNINGLHFMNPITIPLIELCKKADYSEPLLSDLLKSLNKVSYNIIYVEEKSGFLVNRILFKEISYFFYLYEVENVPIKDLKKIYKLISNNADPIKIINMIGLDTSLSILKNLNKQNNDIYVPKILIENVNKGYLGYKNKKTLKL